MGRTDAGADGLDRWVDECVMMGGDDGRKTVGGAREAEPELRTMTSLGGLITEQP